MATADSGVTALQNAMKMAKIAIQLDGGSRHKVVSLSHSVAVSVTRSVQSTETSEPCKQPEGAGAVSELAG